MKSSEQSISIWEATSPQEEFAPLREDLQVDVCIVGAGIAGLSVGYHLVKAGKRVVLLDDNAVGGGETGQTTAHLTAAIDDRYFAVERLHGAEGARFAYESHQRAVERIGEIVAEEGIDCDFVRLDGYLFLAPEHGPDLLDRELDAARRAGFDDVQRLERAPGVPFDTGPCLRYPRQARFHPLEYVRGLTRAIHAGGGRIFTGTHAEEMVGGADAHVRTTDGQVVRAGALVIATNTPVNDRVAIHTKQEPYRTFVIGARVPRGAVADALYWDTLDPYHYVRLQEVGGADGYDMLIVGGEDHRTGSEDDAEHRFGRLEEWTRARFPITSVERSWSGQVIEPFDLMAFIGRNPGDADNVYVVTGDSGQGITHGTIAGMLISDLILGRQNPWEKLYDPSRITLRAAKDFTRATVEMVGHYAEWITGTGSEISSVNELVPGAGGILRRGRTPIAVYRDESGGFHQLSAVCSHLGCIVHWNSEEESWDCPCHGSRFSPTGEVLNGPALFPLPPAEGGGE